MPDLPPVAVPGPASVSPAEPRPTSQQQGVVMDQMSAVRTVLAKTYIGDGTSDSYWCEGEPANVEIERTDDDEIRVGVQLAANASDDATIYLARSEAIRFMLAIAQAVGDR